MVEIGNESENTDGGYDYECEKEFKFKNLGDCRKKMMDKLNGIDSGIEIFTAFDNKGHILFTEEDIPY